MFVEKIAGKGGKWVKLTDKDAPSHLMFWGCEKVEVGE